jgi:anti-anti-sigma factor
MQTKVTTHHTGSACVLRVHGALASEADVPLLNAYNAATTNGGSCIVLDLEHATTINSAGVALVLRIATECGRHEQQIAFSSLENRFATLFRMAGLTQFGTMYATSADAVAMCDRQA